MNWGMGISLVVFVQQFSLGKVYYVLSQASASRLEILTSASSKDSRLLRSTGEGTITADQVLSALRDNCR